MPRLPERLRRATVTSTLCLVWAIHPSPAIGDPPSSTTEASSTKASPAAKTEPIERVAMIGASGTAGFNAYFWRIDDGKTVRDSTTLARILRGASEETLVVSDLGTAQFFMNPAGIGRMAVDRAIASRPDLVVGIDFLFWFCYGSVGPDARRMRTIEDRLKMLDHGLSMVQEITDRGIPLLIGDVPDMSAAEGRILTPGQVPDAETRRRLNERILSWAANRPEVEVFSLDRLQRQLDSDDPIEVAGTTLDERERSWMLQPDRLHPTVGGLLVIMDAIVEQARAHPMLVGRIPAIETDYTANLTRITGFPSMLDQIPIDREQRRSESRPPRTERPE